MSSKKKDKKKEKNKKEKKDGLEPTFEVIDETSKQFYLLQIKDLEEKLSRYQRKSDELELLCKRYEGEFDSLSNDKKDIISNLKKELERKADEILDLNDRLVGLQQAKDAEKEAFEKQLTDLRTEFQETKDTLTNQNNTLLAKLAALDEFKTQKEDLLTKLAELEKKNLQLEEEHLEKLYEIEKKMVLDKDRLKKDMIVKVNQVAADFRRVSNKQMADTTKRTIRENVSINAQLQKMSEKVVEFLSESEKTKSIEKDFLQKIDILENNEKELAKKNASNIKVIRMLTEKCRNQEVMIAELEEKFNEMQDSEISNSQIIVDLEQKSKELKNLYDQNINLKAIIEELNIEAEQKRKTYLNVEQIINDAAKSIKTFLSKKIYVNRTTSLDNIDKKNEDDELSDIEKRNILLENLLIILNGSTNNLKPQLDDSDLTQNQKQTWKHLDVKTQESKQDISSNSSYKYIIGDLGIVPRKEDNLISNIDKMKAFHPQKQLGTLKKVTRKTVATQTIDLAKASIFNKIDYVIESENKVTQQLVENDKIFKKNTASYPLTSLNRVTNKVF